MKNPMNHFSLIALVLTVWLNVTPLFAQSSLELTGTVTDPNGAVVAQASIVAKKLNDPATYRTTSDAQGRYAFSRLSAGSYLIEVTAEKFQSAAKEVKLEAGTSATVDFQLPVLPVTDAVIISARTEIERVLGGVALISQNEINQTAANTLKDIFNFTPGVLAQPRFGSDEAQFSIRGSGLRNNFHLRGVNILIDGVPYQEPDGFSDFESLDLLSMHRVEVWKGANALRYGGNSMGGAVNLVTESGETASPFQLRLLGGSFGLFKGHLSTGGVKKQLSYYLSFSDTEFDGFREHSEQSRKRLYGNLGWKLNEKTDFRFGVIYANNSEKLPGSLTREEFLNTPQKANPNNVTQDWGRFYNYVRANAGLSHQLTNNQEIGFTVFGQYRSMDHPIFEVFDQDSRNFGGEFHYRLNGKLGEWRNRLVVGFVPQFGNIEERHFQNINGRRGNQTTFFGTQARNWGLYFENQLDLSSSFTFVAGGRADWAEREFDDRFLADGDRSDKRTYQAFSPKFGFVWRPFEETQFFGNVSRSYEPPLLLELTSFGAPGFLDLKAQNTWQFEFGTRGQWAPRASWEVTFFNAEIDNEIINLNVQPFPGAPFTIPTYRNAKNTRHLGLEAGISVVLTQNLLSHQDRLTFRTAYTLSRFQFVDDAVYGDNDLPGAPRHLLRSEVRYDHPKGFWMAPNIDWSPATYFVNSPNTEKNDRYAVVNLKAGYDWKQFGFYVEGINLTNRIYSASVQVDAGDGRFFEPSNSRSIVGGFSVRF